jgi:hypothetical protein
MGSVVDIIKFAKKTGYSTKHISEQIQCGRIPAFKLKGKWVISSKLVQVWKDRRKMYKTLRASL